MSWFSPKLEAGEQVVLRLPGRARMDWRDQFRWLAVPAGVVLLSLLTGVGDLESPEYWKYIAFLGAMPILLGVAFEGTMVFVRNYRWRVVVTDRRVIAMADSLLRRQVAIDRRDIAAVTRDMVNQSLVFRLQDREVAVRFNTHSEEDDVLAVLGLEAGMAAA